MCLMRPTHYPVYSLEVVVPGSNHPLIQQQIVLYLLQIPRVVQCRDRGLYKILFHIPGIPFPCIQIHRDSSQEETQP